MFILKRNKPNLKMKKNLVLLAFIALFGLSFAPTNTHAQDIADWKFPHFKEIQAAVLSAVRQGLIIGMPDDSSQMYIMPDKPNDLRYRPNELCLAVLCLQGKQFIVYVDSTGWRETYNNIELGNAYIYKKVVERWNKAVAMYVPKTNNMWTISTTNFDNPQSPAKEHGAQVWYNEHKQNWLSFSKNPEGTEAALAMMDYANKTAATPDTVIGMDLRRDAKDKPWIVENLKLMKFGEDQDGNINPMYPMNLTPPEFKQLTERIFDRMSASNTLKQ